MFVKYRKIIHMKPFKFTFLLVLLASFMFISCDNEPLTGTFTDESGTGIEVGGTGTGTGNSTTTSSFFAKVDGVEFLEDTVYVNMMNLGGSTILTISAAKNNYQSIGLTFPSDIAAGTYTLSSFGDYRAQYNYSQTAIGFGGAGTVTITTHNTSEKKMVGTFSFIATEIVDQTNLGPFNITEGSFDITYN